MQNHIIYICTAYIIIIQFTVNTIGSTVHPTMATCRAAWTGCCGVCAFSSRSRKQTPEKKKKQSLRLRKKCHMRFWGMWWTVCVDIGDFSVKNGDDHIICWFGCLSEVRAACGSCRSCAKFQPCKVEGRADQQWSSRHHVKVNEDWSPFQYEL